MAFAKRGLACLAMAGESTEVRRRELALQKALLIPLAVLEGYRTPAAERVSQRVIELAEQLEDHGSLFAASTAPPSSTWFAVNAWRLQKIASLTQAERLRCVFVPSPECSREAGRFRIAEQVRDLADR